MKFYHGSNTGNIKVLLPKQADHAEPYVYLTPVESVAAIYLCNPLEKPYYWFPYGFEKDNPIPIYHEVYPNALKEVSEGVSGYIYEAEVDEGRLSPLFGNPYAFFSTKSIAISGVKHVTNVYDLFMEYIEQGKLKVSFYNEKSEQQLNWWFSNLVEYLKQKKMAKTPECTYAMFIKEKLPHVWNSYLSQI